MLNVTAKQLLSFQWENNVGSCYQANFIPQNVQFLLAHHHQVDFVSINDSI